MRAPGFWYARPGWQSVLLAPLGAVYACLTARRLRRGRPTDPGVPVVCVGNVNAGGTGKTPTVIALAERLAARGIAVHIVSRGYGGRVEGPVRVDPAALTAADVGDEPLLMAAFAPTWVARRRSDGCRAAVAAGAQAVLMDDGHQDPSVAKTLSIVVADAARGFGNGRCIPAGPLREPAEVGLRRAQALLTIGDRAAQDRFTTFWPTPGIPRLTGRLEPLETGMDWQGLRVLAFAGIGHPGKFFATLKGLGADLVRTVALDDHQPLSPALIARLEADAAALGAQLVTTEKDAVRLPASVRGQVLALPIRLVVDDGPALDALLDRLVVLESVRRR